MTQTGTSTPLWHPFAAMGKVDGHELVLVRGEGCTVWDDDGNEYVDATAGLWFANVGHGRAEIADAVAMQLRTLAAHNIFGDYANQPALDLAARLAGLAPVEDGAVFFGNGGGDAVDTAAKIVRRYWALMGQPQRTVPHEDSGELARVLDELGDRAAAFIGEPVIGAGGVIPPADGYWPEVERICRERDVLLICDEVISGFGRLGTWFGCERYAFTPDLITCAKGVSSGYVPLGAVIASGKVREPFWREDSAPFLHGGTYAGHPGACVAGLVNLGIIERERLVERAAALEPVLRDLLEPLRGERGVADVRSAGLAAAVELDASVLEANPGAPMAAVLAARRHGVLTRPLRGVALQISPPLVISEDELATIVAGVTAGVREAVG